MKYDWDENKHLENIRQHGIDFFGSDAIFDGYTVTVEDHRYQYNERRFITLGLLENRVVVVAHTETEEEIRIISIRKALRHEQKAYFQNSPFPRLTD